MSAVLDHFLTAAGTGAHSPDTRVEAVVSPRGGGFASVAGELDLVTTDAVAAALIRAVEETGPDLAVDVSGVTFCDARGLAALVRAANRAERDGGALTVRGASPLLVRLLRATGLEHRFSGSARRSPSSSFPGADRSG